jgi:hypothetical protein
MAIMKIILLSLLNTTDAAREDYAIHTAMVLTLQRGNVREQAQDHSSPSSYQTNSSQLS